MNSKTCAVCDKDITRQATRCRSCSAKITAEYLREQGLISGRPLGSTNKPKQPDAKPLIDQFVSAKKRGRSRPRKVKRRLVDRKPPATECWECGQPSKVRDKRPTGSHGNVQTWGYCALHWQVMQVARGEDAGFHERFTVSLGSSLNNKYLVPLEGGWGRVKPKRPQPEPLPE